jgi:hypothetical protein
VSGHELTVTGHEIVDPRVLDRLSAELYGSAEIAGRFLRDFIDTWECRIVRLRGAFEGEDADEAFVVVISIRTTSEMVGAVALAAEAEFMQSAIDEHRLPVAAARLPELERIGAETMSLLRRRLEPQGP